mmetsp:Transcript_34877/g.73100  ORF Transcript_34877/g.73100 Transcript_34877/m.73100 type:complete len:91 (-) Transcript_34877:620-892(-)
MKPPSLQALPVRCRWASRLQRKKSQCESAAINGQTQRHSGALRASSASAWDDYDAVFSLFSFPLPFRFLWQASLPGSMSVWPGLLHRLVT